MSSASDVRIRARRQWPVHSAGRAIVKRTGELVTPFKETTMRMFDVQGIEIRAPRGKVFEFLRNPDNLPQWAHAFTSVGDGQARLETPAGAVDVRLGVSADAEAGTVDWRLDFPDGSVGLAHSRVVATSRGTCIYSFVLHAPPMAL